MGINRLALCAGLAFCSLSILTPQARAENVAEVRDEATDGDTSELLASSTNLGSLRKGTWEFTASIRNDDSDENEFVVFDALGPWTIHISSLVLANTSSALVALGNLDSGRSTYLGFKLVDGPDGNLFGELPRGRYFLSVTPKTDVGQASYVARIKVSTSEKRPFTLALSTAD